MKKLLAIVLLTFVSLFAKSQSVDEIIQNHLKAIGGDKWNTLNTMYAELNTDMGGMKIPIKIWQQHMKAMRVEFEVQGMTGIQVVTDKDGWSLMPFQGQTKPQPTNEEQLKSSRSQLDLRGQFVDYKAKGSTVEYLGEDEEDGVEVYKVRLTDKEKTETTYFIDKSSYFIIKANTKAMFQNKEVEASTKFSNYKEVNGLIMAHSVDGQMGKMEFAKIEINPSIEGSKFEMPADK